MATYKVIQDIEAEDKLLGPLTLKQFIYAGITAVCLYVSFLSVTKHALYLLILFMPVALVAGFLAWPWSKEQPTEIWALAKIRFLFKSRLRIWDQSGVKELVTITAPKKIEHTYTDGLSQVEVSSRLRALADTIDSRGWAVKNVNVNLYSQPAAIINEPSSDRLIDVANLPQDVPAVDINASDDIFESPVADHFGQMITATNVAHRQSIMQQLHQSAAATTQTTDQKTPPNDYWFLNQPAQQDVSLKPGYVTFNDSPVVHPGATDDDLPIAPATPTSYEEAMADRFKAEKLRPAPGTSHLRIIQPPSAQTTPYLSPAVPAGALPPTPVTQHPDPAILELANDNDKNVATIARMAKEVGSKQKPEPPDDEVVISLR